MYNERIRNLPVMTTGLIVINVLVFLAMEILGDTQSTQFLYEHGGMYWPSVLEQGQWYRLVTHMFLHAGGEHLLNNMFMLGILGYQIEKNYGSIRYILTYFVSGAVLSALFEMQMGEAAVCIGASGAVFGIFGAMLVMIFKNRRQMGEVSAPRLLILFVLMVFGNMEEGVDWMAHLGGALLGVVMAFILYRPQSKVRFNL